MRVLIDNIENGKLCGEWGLSVLIEYEGKHYLLDAGTTGAFADNAAEMGIDLSRVDYAVLSHAHYDHADGFPAFFERNDKAKLYIRAASAENCYSAHEDGMEYIGIRRGFLESYAERIARAEGVCKIAPGVTLLPHTSPAVYEAGRKAKMFTEAGGRLIPERFEHEQTLVFETGKGLVLFNSCSHGGADTIIREVMEAFPGQTVYAVIGGFHLFRTGAEDVRRMAKRLSETGVRWLITGHCTGEEAFDILQETFGDRILKMHSGFEWAV